MIRFNESELVMMSVIGEVSSPVVRTTPYRISPDGVPRILPGVGGITYNVRVGDLVSAWQADHVEPCVSTKNSDSQKNGAYNVLACAGNEARVLSGEAKGATGIVTGKHGGIEHVLIDFDDKTVEKLAIGDKVQIKAIGLGMRLLDYPEIKIMNVAPNLLKAIPLKEDRKNGVLTIPVTHLVPAALMGSGLGADNAQRGDYDIQLFDETLVREYGLEDLRFGDLVAIINADHSFGRIYKTGAVSVGVVVHSACTTAGHGPGVMTLFTSATGKICPQVDAEANIGRFLKIGRYRTTRRKSK